MCYIFQQYLALTNVFATRRNEVLNREQIEQALKTVKDVLGPGDVVSEGRVEKITVDGGRVMLTLKLPTDDPDIKRAVEDLCRAAVKEVGGWTA